MSVQDEAPAEPKKRGRRPGMPKVPGSGRKPGGVNNTPPKETIAAILARGEVFTGVFEHLAAIASGRPVDLIGPTGKRTRGPAPIRERVAAAGVILAKLIPNQQSSTVEVNAKTEIKQEVRPSTRDLARAILTILHKAQIEDPNAVLKLEPGRVLDSSRAYAEETQCHLPRPHDLE